MNYKTLTGTTTEVVWTSQTKGQYPLAEALKWQGQRAGEKSESGYVRQDLPSLGLKAEWAQDSNTYGWA